MKPLPHDLKTGIPTSGLGPRTTAPGPIRRRPAGGCKSRSNKAEIKKKEKGEKRKKEKGFFPLTIRDNRGIVG